jgi:hypothetical protein
MNDVWGRRLFTAGTVMLLLIGLVHAFSLIGTPTPANDTEKQLFSLMRDYHFNLMGSSRSMNDLIRGFSMSFMLAAFGFGIFDLVLRKQRTELLKNVALVNILWLGAMMALSLRYFFAVPTSFLATTLILFALAWFKLPARTGAPS